MFPTSIKLSEDTNLCIIHLNFELNNSCTHQKIGYIPEERQKMGLVLQFSIAQNLILNAFKNLPFCRNLLYFSILDAQTAMIEEIGLLMAGGTRRE